MNAELQKRLIAVHRQAKAHSTVPVDAGAESGLLLLYALNWEDWADDLVGHKRLGVRSLASLIDHEHYVEDEFEFGVYDHSLPAMPSGRNWKMGTFNLRGEDTDDAPLDVEWTFDQLGQLM